MDRKLGKYLGEEGCYHLVAMQMTRPFEHKKSRRERDIHQYRKDYHALFCDCREPIKMYKKQTRKHLEITYPSWQSHRKHRALIVFQNCRYSCGTPRCVLLEYYPLSSDLTDLFRNLPPRYVLLPKVY